ncbi:MAG TPA: AgmX/PglI C-terminal domain-containing protein, partial [Sorangium sp.]|nr:AgmX/PglI C-terminal domain-containing protein [Sorangium sp.]
MTRRARLLPGRLSGLALWWLALSCGGHAPRPGHVPPPHPEVATSRQPPSPKRPPGGPTAASAPPPRGPTATAAETAHGARHPPPATSVAAAPKKSAAATTSVAAAAPPKESATTTSAAAAAPPKKSATATSANISITIEAPYKYGQRATPTTRAAYLADIRERRRWNDGGVGTLLGHLPAPPGHPDPRVIVNVEKVRGGQRARTLQVVARRYHWMNIIRCYRLGAYKDQTLRGWTEARLEVTRRGEVKSARLLSTKLKDAAVAHCMVDTLKKLTFPSAGSGTSVWLRMRVGPGDEPQRPPTDVLEAGPGSLPQEGIIATVEAAYPAFEACYRQALDVAPGLWGRIVIRFHVDRRGKVDEAFQTESRF